MGTPTELEQALLEADVALAEARLADAQRECREFKSHHPLLIGDW